MSIADNIKAVQDRIADACTKANRNPSDITLIAISKQKPAADILRALEAGLQHIGENRVEEAVDKIPQVDRRAGRRVTWHMVGHVQSRKAKQVASHFDVVQSVDSLRLARRLSRFAAEQSRSLDILLEINISGEASKYGFEGYNWYRDNAVKDRLLGACDSIADLPSLQLTGLMTMAPYAAEESVIRRVFADLFALREELALALRRPLPVLSMGMTDDYATAIQEGATMIRVGRAIFGERNLNEK